MAFFEGVSRVAFQGKAARLLGYEHGRALLHHREGDIAVLRIAGQATWSGRGQARSYAGARMLVVRLRGESVSGSRGEVYEVEYIVSYPARKAVGEDSPIEAEKGR